MDKSPENMALVERFHRAEHLIRELSEHLRQSLLPRLSELRQSSKVFAVSEVSDQELMDRMQAALQSEQFARGLHDRLQGFLRSIEGESDRILNP